MPLILKGKSKARLEIQWNGVTPVEVSIVPIHDTSIILYQQQINTGRMNVELSQLDFTKLPHANEVELVASIQGDLDSTSEALPVQKCHHPKCGLWGHVKEDGYCKHCGRRIKDQSYACGFPKLEISDFSVTLWNGIQGQLRKKKEIREDRDGVFSIGRYEDKYRPLDYVEIVEEKFDQQSQQRFLQLYDLLKQTGLLGSQWKPPLACFQEEYHRTLWIYYPRSPKQSKWRTISALSYIMNDDVELLTTLDIIHIGIQLCDIISKIHRLGYIWGSLKLSDLLLCRDKRKNISICLNTQDISWDGPPSPKLLDMCLIPWELFWEKALEPNLYKVTEVYIVAVLLYFLKAKAPNLLSYNSLSYQNSLPCLKLFSPGFKGKKPEKNPAYDYFESTINQALLLDPQERGYRNIEEFKLALEYLLQMSSCAAFNRPYVFNVGEALDVGNEKREHDLSKNQDAIFTSAVTLEKQKWGLFALCDGISTSTVGSGDRASRIIIDTLRKWWQNESEKERKAVCQYATTNLTRACKFLNDIISKANKRICQDVHELVSAEELEDALVMGSTVSVGLIYNNIVVYGWLGDSPIYRISAWGWERLNFEDNERNFRIRCGMPLDECFIEGGNALTRCVGAHFYMEKQIALNFGYTYLYPGEYLLICSDGIPDYIEQEAAYAYHESYQMLRISSILQEYSSDILLDAKALATILISIVNKVGGGYDNLSAILLSTIPESEISFEKTYQKLKSLSPTMRKLLDTANFETQKNKNDPVNRLTIIL